MKISLLNSLFKARQDAFAIHWQKGKKSGYMPAYSYDPYMYGLHKRKGGTFKDYKDKIYLPLTDVQIEKHLNGEKLIGIYPLLKDNTSLFIVADFDKQKWTEECRKFIEICIKNNIPAYLERSRSGKGGHVWIFFEQAYPAIKSRKIIINLLEQVGLFSVFDKSSSFDRLFPNQDFLFGKGLGNLIALPFYKPAFEQGNSCFVDPTTEGLNPYPDQWQFLSSIQKTSVNHLDKLYDSLMLIPESSNPVQNTSGKLQIKLSNTIRLNRAEINGELTNLNCFQKSKRAGR